MKITPKLLIGKMITEDKNIKDADKIKMLGEIVHLNEEELDDWIEKVILEGKETSIAKVISKYGNKATKATKAYFKPTQGSVIDRTIRGTSKKAWEKPLRTIAKVGVVGVAGTSVYNAIAKRLNSCKVSCKEQYKVTKNKEQFSKCMTYCQHIANASTNKAKESGK